MIPKAGETWRYKHNRTLDFDIHIQEVIPTEDRIWFTYAPVWRNTTKGRDSLRNFLHDFEKVEP